MRRLRIRFSFEEPGSDNPYTLPVGQLSRSERMLKSISREVLRKIHPDKHNRDILEELIYCEREYLISMLLDQEADHIAENNDRAGMFEAEKGLVGFELSVLNQMKVSNAAEIEECQEVLKRVSGRTGDENSKNDLQNGGDVNV